MSAVLNYLDMSDEELMKQPVPVATATEPVVEKDEEVVAEPAVVVDAPAGEGAKTAADAVAADDDAAEDAADIAAAAKERDEKGRFKGKSTEEALAEVAEAAKAAGASQAAAAADAADAVKIEEKKDEVAKPDQAAEVATDKPAVDYKAEYDRLLAPFKANGRDVQVHSVDDAVALMQMGANYNKKMAALKPNLKLLKSLEHNDLLSEEKINYLIDLAKKNPSAIQKLVSESGIDPMEFDAEKAKSYKASSYAVDDREIELDTILEDLQGSSAYTQTLNVVSNKWDLASKQTISKTPQLLRVIHDHVASGVYDLISAEMDRDRMLGRLSGLSDIEAYRQVGDAIHARGGFNHLAQGTKPAQAATKQPPEVALPKPKQVDDDKLKDKRRAASSTKPAAPSTNTLKDFNPLGMSDEEFAKLSTPKFT